MCNECWKEFRGWCRAFTRIERALSLLELVLLVLLVGFLAFLTLHLLVCSDPVTYTAPTSANTIQTETSETTTTVYVHTTLNPKIECTWEPSVKTEPRTRYYATQDEEPTTSILHDRVDLKVSVDVSDSDSDGEETNDEWKSFVIALVKMRPPHDITFGCILTIVAEFWAVTAASCIEAIEELDSLDSFVMMEDYGGESHGPVHAIADLRVHPFYRDTNGSYDVAALRSHDSLTRGRPPAATAAPLDYALLTIGQRFHLLGYGAFRSIDRGPNGRRLRAAHVYSLPARSCAGADGGGALRHLAGGRAAGAAPPAPAALCAGVKAVRALPCNYCGGAPLLRAAGARRGVLVALMRDNAHCGVACEPALYTPLVALLDWIDGLERL